MIAGSGRWVKEEDKARKRANAAEVRTEKGPKAPRLRTTRAQLKRLRNMRSTSPPKRYRPPLQLKAQSQNDRLTARWKRS